MSKDQTSMIEKKDLVELAEHYIRRPFKIEVWADGADLRFEFLAAMNSDFSSTLFAQTLRYHWTALSEESPNVLRCVNLATSSNFIQTLENICNTLRAFGWAVEVK